MSFINGYIAHFQMGVKLLDAYGRNVSICDWYDPHVIIDDRYTNHILVYIGDYV